MRMLEPDRRAQSLRTALRNTCLESDYERLPQPVRDAVELLLTATISHPFFSVHRVAALLTAVADEYRQSLHRDDPPKPRHLNHR